MTALRVPGGNLVDGLPPARQDGQKRNLPLWEQFQSGLSADATLWRPSPTDHSVPATCYPKQITGSFLFSPVSVYRNWFEKAWPKQKGSFKVAVGTILDSAHFCFCFRFRSSVAFVLPFSHLSFYFFIVPIVRCHALCCFTRRAWWVVCSPAFLLRCRWFCAPLDREGALRLSAPVQVSGLYFDRRAGVSTSLFQQCCVVFLVLGFLNFRSLAKFWLFHISSVALGHESCVGGQQLKFCRSMCLVSYFFQFYGFHELSSCQFSDFSLNTIWDFDDFYIFNTFSVHRNSLKTKGSKEWKKAGKPENWGPQKLCVSWRCLCSRPTLALSSVLVSSGPACASFPCFCFSLPVVFVRRLALVSSVVGSRLLSGSAQALSHPAESFSTPFCPPCPQQRILLKWITEL